jgi:hypothetical protein
MCASVRECPFDYVRVASQIAMHELVSRIDRRPSVDEDGKMLDVLEPLNRKLLPSDAVTDRPWIARQQ